MEQGGLTRNSGNVCKGYHARAHTPTKGDQAGTTIASLGAIYAAVRDDEPRASPFTRLSPLPAYGSWLTAHRPVLASRLSPLPAHRSPLTTSYDTHFSTLTSHHGGGTARLRKKHGVPPLLPCNYLEELRTCDMSYQHAPGLNSGAGFLK
jgi:hypothetical protein